MSQYRCFAPPPARLVLPEADSWVATLVYPDAPPAAASPARSSTAMGPPTTSIVTALTARGAPRSRSRPTPSFRFPKSALVYLCVRHVVPSRRKPLPPEGSTLETVACSPTDPVELFDEP